VRAASRLRGTRRRKRCLLQWRTNRDGAGDGFTELRKIQAQEGKHGGLSMESEHNTGVDDQLLTVQEIAGLLKVPNLPGCTGTFGKRSTDRLPRTDSANTGALGPGKCWPGSQGIAAAGRRF